MKFIKFTSIFTLSALVLTACAAAGEPDRPAEEVVQEGMINLSKVTSGSYEIAVNGVLDPEDIAGENGEELEEAEVDFTFDGVYNSDDPENPMFALAMNMNISMDDSDDETVAGELRLIGENVYFQLTELTDFDETLPPGLIEPYQNKWWYMAVPPTVLEAFEAYAPNKDEEDPQMQELQELYEETMMLKELKYLGSETVTGEMSYKYAFVLDEDAVIDYVIKSSEIVDPAMVPSEQEIADMREFFASVDIEGEVAVGSESKTVRGFYLDLEAEDLEGVDMDFEISYEVGDINEGLEVEVPTDAAIFDPTAFFLGAMGAGATTQGSMTGIEADGDFTVTPVDPAELNLAQ